MGADRSCCFFLRRPKGKNSTPQLRFLAFLHILLTFVLPFVPQYITIELSNPIGVIHYENQAENAAV